MKSRIPVHSYKLKKWYQAQVSQISIRAAFYEVCSQTNIKHTLGGMAGSLNLNKRFECAVKELVGEKQWSALHPSKGFQRAASQFEKEIKKGFHGGSDDDCFDDEFYVNFYPAKLADNPNCGLESNTWTMVEYVKDTLPQTAGKCSCFVRDDLMDIFNPVIGDILKLINEQVERVKVKMGGEGPKVFHHIYHQLRKESNLTAYSIFSWLAVLAAIDI